MASARLIGQEQVAFFPTRTFREMLVTVSVFIPIIKVAFLVRNAYILRNVPVVFQFLVVAAHTHWYTRVFIHGKQLALGARPTTEFLVALIVLRPVKEGAINAGFHLFTDTPLTFGTVK